jgi:Na+/melibiose symporter-like transporter
MSPAAEAYMATSILSAGALSMAQVLPEMPDSWASAPVEVVLGVVCMLSLYLFYRQSRESVQEIHQNTRLVHETLTRIADEMRDSTTAQNGLAAELRRSPCLLHRMAEERGDRNPPDVERAFRKAKHEANGEGTR